MPTPQESRRLSAPELHRQTLAKIQTKVSSEFGEGVSVKDGVREAYTVFGNTTELAQFFGVSRRTLDQFLTKEDIQRERMKRRGRKNLTRRVGRDPEKAAELAALHNAQSDAQPTSVEKKKLPKEIEVPRERTKQWKIGGVVFTDALEYEAAVRDTLLEMFIGRKMTFGAVMAATGLNPIAIRRYAKEVKICFVSVGPGDYRGLPIVESSRKNSP